VTQHVIHARRASFNPRPRVEGDWEISKRFTVANQFQSAPSRGGRYLLRLEFDSGLDVSIRALAWRAMFRLTA